jgi:CelD/BcsL family acetyltransferase involved in cellulose biosynthesis
MESKMECLAEQVSDTYGRTDPIFELDPLLDPRWVDLLERDNRASIFHTPAWLEALKRTYGYKPIALTTSCPGQPLSNAIPFCVIDSRITGCRLVSLPFSDHCEPLVDSEKSLLAIQSYLSQGIKAKRWKYVELRPLTPIFCPDTLLKMCEEFFFHRLDLSPSPEQLLKSFHQASIRRKIMRAEREDLVYEVGRSRELLAKFYALFAMTRKRHRLPPPPFKWLCNLVDCFGNDIEVRLTSKGFQPTAGMITIRYKRTIFYKYGGSDIRFNNLGGTAMLFWRTILDAKHSGLRELDFGRCELDNPGLIRYKDRWGSIKSQFSYWRTPTSQAISGVWKLRTAKRFFSLLPDRLRIKAGELIYPHIG